MKKIAKMLGIWHRLLIYLGITLKFGLPSIFGHIFEFHIYYFQLRKCNVKLGDFAFMCKIWHVLFKLEFIMTSVLIFVILAGRLLFRLEVFAKIKLKLTRRF